MGNQIFKKINYQKLPKTAAIFNFLTIGLFEINALISPMIVSVVARDIATLIQMMLFFLRVNDSVYTA